MYIVPRYRCTIEITLRFNCPNSLPFGSLDFNMHLFLPALISAQATITVIIVNLDGPVVNTVGIVHGPRFNSPLDKFR